tara:strand:- start:263 stop:451 length:189 start_codon:yes stop_codon:yes gene_type:complete
MLINVLNNIESLNIKNKDKHMIVLIQSVKIKLGKPVNFAMLVKDIIQTNIINIIIWLNNKPI